MGVVCPFFFFKHKTAYEMRISDWSSDVCSSDLKADSAESLFIHRHYPMQLSPSNPIGKIRFKTWKVRGKPSPDGQPRLAVPHPLGLDAPATPPDEEIGRAHV